MHCFQKCVCILFVLIFHILKQEITVSDLTSGTFGNYNRSVYAVLQCCDMLLVSHSAWQWRGHTCVHWHFVQVSGRCSLWIDTQGCLGNEFLSYDRDTSKNNSATPRRTVSIALCPYFSGKRHLQLIDVLTLCVMYLGMFTVKFWLCCHSYFAVTSQHVWYLCL